MDLLSDLKCIVLAGGKLHKRGPQQVQICVEMLFPAVVRLTSNHCLHVRANRTKELEKKIHTPLASIQLYNRKMLISALKQCKELTCNAYCISASAFTQT